MNKENSQYIFLNFPDLDFQEKSVGFYPTFYSTYHGMHYLSVYEDGPFTSHMQLTLLKNTRLTYFAHSESNLQQCVHMGTICIQILVGLNISVRKGERRKREQGKIRKGEK